MNSQIEIKNLSRNFDKLQVLYSLDLQVYKGEVLSILGPSGSGKTTLLRCISGLDQDFSGSLLINSINQQEYLETNRIAFVPQKYSNFTWMTVRENIRLGFKLLDITDKEKNIKTDDFINSLELKGFGNYFPNQLSGGMQQRVAIGRALAQNTEILAMDEPFGALDYQTRESLQLLIKDLNSKYNKTILFVTHDIEEALFISDRIAILSKIPSNISNTYKIPKIIKEDVSENARFNMEFIELRKSIEKDLKTLNN